MANRILVLIAALYVGAAIGQTTYQYTDEAGNTCSSPPAAARRHAAHYSGDSALGSSAAWPPLQCPGRPPRSRRARHRMRCRAPGPWTPRPRAIASSCQRMSRKTLRRDLQTGVPANEAPRRRIDVKRNVPQDEAVRQREAIRRGVPQSEDERTLRGLEEDVPSDEVARERGAIRDNQ